MVLVDRFLRIFRKRKEKALLRRLTRGIPSGVPFSAGKLAKLTSLVASEDFSIFLEYLELTISENLVMLSTIELLDEDGRKRAVKLQNQTRGILFTRDLVEDLINRSKELAKVSREKEDERN